MIRLIIILFLICYSCSPGTGITEKSAVSPIQTISQDSLYLYLTGGFKNDSLVIEYADIRIVEPDITTSALGYAKAFAIPSTGTERIKVSLIRPENNYTTEIINSGNNFIEVWYCKDDVLKHYSRNEPFINE